MASRACTERLPALAALVVAAHAGGCSPPAPPRGEVLSDLKLWDSCTSDARRAAAEEVARREPAFKLLRWETFSGGGQSHEVAIYEHASTALEFVLVPAGSFQMGASLPVGVRSGDTQHTVTLSQPFLVARTECTQAAYEKVMGTNPSSSKGAQLPVEDVSWNDAKMFCDKSGLALPTEAQWEYACRGGTTSRYWSGDAEDDLTRVGWWSANSGGRTHPVGEKPANPLGLMDVHGNVYELCADWFWTYPRGPATDPVGPEQKGSAENRILRGGSYFGSAGLATSADRHGDDPDARSPEVGFRPVKTVAQ